MLEEPLILGAHGNLIGILSRAEAAPQSSDNQRRTAVVLLNAGLIHHVGPGRIYVTVARELARRGFASLRLDFSGVGDSLARPDGIPVLELAEREPKEAMDALESRGFDRFVLMGICSGAYAAFRAATADLRVVGVILVNPQEFVGDPNWGAYSWAQRYWSRSIFSPRAWRNLLTGRINYKRLFKTLGHQLGRGLLGGNRQAAREAKQVMAEIDQLADQRRPALFLLSDDDVSVDQLSLMVGQDVRKMHDHPSLQFKIVPGADHLFTRERDKVAVIALVTAWISELTHPKSAAPILD